MRFNRVWVSWLLLASQVVQGQATPSPAPTPTPAAASGVTTDVLLKTQQKDPFMYDPINPEFWGSVTYNMTLENYIKVFVIADRYIRETKGQTDDESEGKLALALALEKKGFVFGSSILFGELVQKRIGTLVAVEALRGLNRIAQSGTYDFNEIGEDILSSNEFGPLPPDLQSFVAFHAGLFNLTQGFNDWAEKDFSKVVPGSYWAIQLDYYRALNEVSQDKFDLASSRLDSLQEPAKPYPALYQKIQLQRARIMFERGEFPKSYDTYRSLINLPAREEARVLVERAWARFYERDYSKALGEILVLESPRFDELRPFEAYVLKMLIFKELCHYNALYETTKQFRERYKSAIEAIRKRKILRNEVLLAKQALLHTRRQQLANIVNQIRTELQDLTTYNFLEIEGVPTLIEKYRAKETELKTRLETELDQGTTEAAELLLDTEEQVSFLDYTARLDGLRIISKGEDRRYESQQISHTSFEFIFWPVTKEFWLDELPEYKVLLRSQCDKYESAVTSEKGDFK